MLTLIKNVAAHFPVTLLISRSDVVIANKNKQTHSEHVFIYT